MQAQLDVRKNRGILCFKLCCIYIMINAVSPIRTLSGQNFEPINKRGSDKRGCTVTLFGIYISRIFVKFGVPYARVPKVTSDSDHTPFDTRIERSGWLDMIRCLSFCRVSSCVSIHFAVHFFWATTKRFLGAGRHELLSRLGMASALAASRATYRITECRR